MKEKLKSKILEDIKEVIKAKPRPWPWQEAAEQLSHSLQHIDVAGLNRTIRIDPNLLQSGQRIFENCKRKAESLKPEFDAIESYEEKTDFVIYHFGPFLLDKTIIDITPNNEKEKAFYNRRQFEWCCRKEAEYKKRNIDERYGITPLKSIFKEAQLREFERELKNSPDSMKQAFDSLVLQNRLLDDSGTAVEAYGLFEAWCYVENELGKTDQKWLEIDDISETEVEPTVSTWGAAMVCVCRGVTLTENKAKEMIVEVFKKQDTEGSKLYSYWGKLKRNFEPKVLGSNSSEGSHKTQLKKCIKYLEFHGETAPLHVAQKHWDNLI